MTSHIAIVVSQYNKHISDALLEGAASQLRTRGIESHHIHTIKVPGAVEIPLTTQLLAKSQRYAAIICLGTVICGDTDHYIYVCEQVSQGCQKVMLDWNIPIIFGVLTVKNEEQANDRIGGKEGHKGIEAADAAVDMIQVMETIRHL